MRHGRSAPDPTTPPETWGLDPGGLAEIDELAASERLPTAGAWYTSPEPKASQTARRLTRQELVVVPELAEHRRGVRWFADPSEFRAAVRRAFDEPRQRAVPEWEPLTALRERLLPAVSGILRMHPHDDDVVLVGHGTAWTLLVAELTGGEPDLDAWAALRMPDVWALSVE